MSSSRCSEFHKIFEFQSIGLMPIQEDFLIFRKDRGFFVLADGFGGPGSGDQIAQTACEAIEYFLEKEAGDEDATLPFHLRSYFTIPGNVLFNAVLYANKKILEFNKGRPLSKRGGCSLIVGMIHQGTLALAQVGLCRAHLRRGSAWKQLNQERSFLKFRDPFCEMTEALSDVPLTALGLSDSLEPEILEYKVQAEDELYISTDGLGCLQAGNVDVKTLSNQSFRDNASLLALKLKL